MITFEIARNATLAWAAIAGVVSWLLYGRDGGGGGGNGEDGAAPARGEGRTLRLAAINIYPVKGGSAMSIETSWPLWRGGLQWDRYWMVVQDGVFVSQREVSRLALLSARLVLRRGGDGRREGELVLRLPDAGLKPFTLGVPSALLNGELATQRARDGASPAHCTATIWGQSCAAIDCGDAVAAWVTRSLGHDTPLRLVRASEAAGQQRAVLESHDGETVPARWRRAFCGAQPPSTTAAWCDSAPFLVTSTASLDALNASLRAAAAARGARAPAVPMNRFRPNLVVAGAAPFAEDAWREIAIVDAATSSAGAGATERGVRIRIDKPCSRCQVPSIEQSTGVIDARPFSKAEPTRTLKEFRQGKHLGYKRKWSGALFFGMHAHEHAPADDRTAAQLRPRALVVGSAVALLRVSSAPRREWT